MNTVRETIKHNAGVSEDDHDLLDVNDLITSGKDGFAAFTVTGDSMIAEIQPGYIVFVGTFAIPAHGDIIASSVNGKLNVKILEKQTNGLFLVSVNKKYKPRQIVESDNFRILGVVKGHLAVY